MFKRRHLYNGTTYSNKVITSRLLNRIELGISTDSTRLFVRGNRDKDFSF